MSPDEFKKYDVCTLCTGAKYRYGLEGFQKTYTLRENNTNYDYIRNVVFEEKLEKPVLIDSDYYNVKLVVNQDIYIYTNSYYLIKTNQSKQQTNSYTTNISEYIDDRLDAVNKDLVDRYDGYFIGVDFSSDLDVVEIRNSKAWFNRKPTEEDIKRRFERGRSQENKIYPDEVYIEPQADWIKEFIHMNIEKKIDDALKDGDREEFIRLSNKLKEMEK